MSDIYKLDDLDGITVGAGQNFDNFAEIIDYLLETRPYGEVKELLGFDSRADLSEYLVDSKGNYDESEAREICMNALGGEDIDEEDPYAEWGDHMYDRAAGKQVFLMNDAQKWLDQIIEDIPFIEKGIYEDAKTLGTYGKAKKYVRSFKHDFGGDFSGTPEEQMYSAFNTMLEDVVSKLNQDSNNAEIKK